MQTNHLSHFLLTRELMPALERAAALRGEARVVSHTSLARQGAPMTAEVAAEYLGPNGGNLGGDNASFDGPGRWLRYHFSKLSNIMFTLALDDKLSNGVKALAAAPGLAATNLQVTTASDGVDFMQGFMDSTPCQSAEDGAVPLLTCCLSAGVKSGELYEPADNGGWTGPAHLKTLVDKDAVCVESDRAAFWAASEKAVGAWALLSAFSALLPQPMLERKGAIAKKKGCRKLIWA